jgi:recombinational DNA repair ATPase RecF
MIRVDKLVITEFRGIRSLRLDLDKKSFLVLGPNGTGKSGIVDAIDFALTGSVARLTGAGTGGITVLRHAPHVSHRDKASEARVELTFTDTTSGTIGTLSRTVRTAKTFTLTPDTPALRAAVAVAAAHPELILTRRDVLKFVLAEPGKRSDEVQALLKLERLGTLRKTLKTASGQLTSQKAHADAEATGAARDLAMHTGRDQVLVNELLEAVNQRRTLLGAAPLARLDAHTDLRAGVELPSDTGPRPAAVTRAVDETAALVEQLRGPFGTDTLARLTDALGVLSAAADTAASAQAAQLARAGMTLATGDTCPLCDTQWPSGAELREHLSAKLDSFTGVQQVQDDATAAAVALGQTVGELTARIRAAITQAEALGTPTAEIRVILTNWHGRLTGLRTRLGEISNSPVPGSNAGASVGVADLVEADVDLTCEADDPLIELASLRSMGAALPDLSTTVQASEWLTLAQERWARLVRTRSSQQKAAAAAKTGALLYETYCNVQDAALESLYRAIEARFAEHYQQINEGDEDTFKAQLEPDAGKLDLTVDFYNIGMFPPGAYHSEGHQDGMGLALYLALLEHLLGDDLTFVVLDDVITSIDIAHRRKICDLLHLRFPDVQFVITTHEQIWAETLVKRGVVTKKGSVEFHNWSVETGPLCADTRDVFAQIDADLAAANVPAAAAKLRLHLEASMRHAAGDLRAKVAYRPDADYSLGDLLPAVSGKYKELLGKAARAADKWKNDDQVALTARLEAERKIAVSEHDTESWAINKMVHDNPEYNLTAGEFTHTLKAAQLFLSLFACPSCQQPVRLEGHPEATMLRCPCAGVNVNLQMP